MRTTLGRPSDGLGTVRPMQAGDLIAQVANPEGRIVRIDTSAWNHVLEEHAELEPFLEEARPQ
jgi:hypothetical protein